MLSIIDYVPEIFLRYGYEIFSFRLYIYYSNVEFMPVSRVTPIIKNLIVQMSHQIKN